MAWKVSSSGGGGTTPSVINSGTSAVVTTGTVITMPNAMPNTNYLVFFNCYNGNGAIGCDIINKTINSFEVSPLENATFEYIASALSV